MATPNNFRVKSGLNVGTTIAGGNTTITGFANVSTSVNSASLTVGSSFIANSTGITSTGFANVATTLAAGNTTITGFANVTGNVQISTINATSFGATLTSNSTTAILTLGNSSVTATMNNSTFSGTANNSTNLGGSSLATVQGQITGNAATAYTNAIAIAANGSNISSGTVAFARLPSLFVGTTTIQSTSAAQALSGITTLAAGNTTITGDITVSGNLTINGTTTNINSTNLVVEDKNIVLADVTTPTDVTADGGGITLKGGTDKTFNWVDATDSWTSSEHIDLAAGKVYKIGTTTIANSTALGTGILASSLTSVGTLSSLTLGGAVSGITTLAAGNTTITGFANVSISVNSALFTVGTTATINSTSLSAAGGNFVANAVGISVAGSIAAACSSFTANTTGAFHTGTVNAASFTTTGLTINATAIVPTSNSSGQTLGNTTSRFVLSANSIDTTGSINIAAGQVLKFNNDVGISRSTAAVLSIGNGTQNDSTGTISLTGGLFQGAVNAASHTVGSSFIANSTGVTTTGFANVSTTLQVGGITTHAANVVMANNFITRPVLAGYSEHEVSNTAVTGTFTLDFSTANFFDLILTGNTTISPSGVPANTRMVSATLVAKQDATGGRTITWPAGTKYAGGVSPPATTTANAIDIWSIMTYDAGNTYIVSLSVKGAA